MADCQVGGKSGPRVANRGVDFLLEAGDVAF